MPEENPMLVRAVFREEMVDIYTDAEVTVMRDATKCLREFQKGTACDILAIDRRSPADGLRANQIC